MWRLIARFARPHWALITAVAVLQVLQSIASLYLPELSAEIINQGVAAGNTRLILSTGAVMLAVALVQIACSFAAVYFSARTAMTMPPILRIGADTSIVHVIRTRVCTCCTSFVVRVMSDGAPKRDTSCSENSPM